MLDFFMITALLTWLKYLLGVEAFGAGSLVVRTSLQFWRCGEGFLTSWVQQGSCFLALFFQNPALEWNVPLVLLLSHL